MADIKTKREFYDLYYKLALGNTIRQWEYDEFARLAKAGDPSLPATVAVRCKIPDHPWMRYDLSIPAALAYVEELVDCEGAIRGWFQFSEHAPDHWVTLQGEVMRSERYYDLKYCLHSRTRMRYAMQNAKHTAGLHAHLLLKAHMDGPSWDCLQELLSLYPDSIIEFGCYEIPTGVLGWNTIIWEVRNY